MDTNKNLKTELSNIKPTDDAKLDLLGKEITENARKDVLELIKILRSSKGEELEKASMVLMAVGDLVVTPLLDSLDKNNPDNYMWEMEILVSRHFSNRNRIALVLNDMLLDKRELKGPELIGPVEKRPAPRRVCDSAYLILRKLFAFREDQETLLTNEKLFLDLTMKERDKEIDRIRSSDEWISLSEYFSEGEP